MEPTVIALPVERDGSTRQVAVRWDERGPVLIVDRDGHVREQLREPQGDELIYPLTAAEWAWEQIDSLTLTKKARGAIRTALGLEA